MRIMPMAAAVPLVLVAMLAERGVEPTHGATALSGNQATAAADRTPAADEFVGPFASWANLREQYGATGDGTTDDTAALQAALDRLGPDNASPVLFIPAGSYRITRPLALNFPLGVGVIGEEPDRTRIVWDGPAGGTMLTARGMAYSRINRLTFDGRGRASVAVEQTFDNTRGNFDTGNEYADDRFIDVEYGIRGGFEGYGFAETSVMRARFVRNTRAGIALGNFNALDLWVWHSLFEDCGVGISNDPGAGNYRVYDSVFRRSTIADLQMQNTGGFTARGNYSIGSKAFWISGPPINHPATIDIQDNTIIDPQSALVVKMGNQGPALIMDNHIRSQPNTGGPIISWSSLFGSDVTSIGNTFTVSNAISANGRLVTLDDRIVTRDAIDATEPPLPAAPRNLRRRVIEVSAGATGEAIQRAIDRAASERGERPIVHLPYGRYDVGQTIVVPAGDVQLVGDGMRTTVRWSGAERGPVIVLQPPTRATIRELQIDGATSADGVVASGIDQPGSRVYAEGVQLRSGKSSNLLVDGAGRAQVQLVDFGHAYSPQGTSIRIVGGPSAASPDAGRTVIHSGASAGNGLSYEISEGGTLVARDIWYEGTADRGFLRVASNGTAVFQGARVATPRGWTPPAFTVDSAARRFTMLTTLFDDRLVVSGTGGRADVLGLSNLREDSPQPAVTNSDGRPAHLLMLNARQRSKAGGFIPRGTTALADIGTLDAAYVRAMLRDVRALPEPSLEPVPAGATDLRLFRVWMTGGSNNLVLSGRAR
jgi:pectin methylesterase-like acyl-CoA thioesterase